MTSATSIYRDIRFRLRPLKRCARYYCWDTEPVVNLRTLYRLLKYAAYDHTVDRRRTRLQNEIALLTNNEISDGPFAGVWLIPTWWGGNRGNMLLGFYEQELAAAIEEVIAWRPDVIIDVGCAEGYYAVGMARRVLDAENFAYDVSPFARAACRQAAKLNGVYVTVLRQCTASELRTRSEAAARPFMLLDCEGGETELLIDHDYNFPNARILVECHDYKDRRITPSLLGKFAATHSIATITETERDPLASPITEILPSWKQDALRAVLCERRPEKMHWLYLVPAPQTIPRAPIPDAAITNPPARAGRDAA